MYETIKIMAVEDDTTELKIVETMIVNLMNLEEMRENTGLPRDENSYSKYRELLSIQSQIKSVVS